MERAAKHPGFWVAVGRGMAGRCPRCGSKDLFATRWRMRPRCPQCQLQLEREEGAFLGSMTINYALTGIIGLAYMVIVMIFAQGAPLWLLIVGGIAILAIVPALFYPRTKTIWTALDFIAFRLEHERPRSEG